MAKHTTYFDDDEYQAIQERASERDDESVSAVVREAVRAQLEVDA